MNTDNAGEIWDELDELSTMLTNFDNKIVNDSFVSDSQYNAYQTEAKILVKEIDKMKKILEYNFGVS